MTFTKLSDYSYTALSTDAKTTVGVNIGARLLEYDTAVVWVFDGTAWRESNEILLDSVAAIQVATEATRAAIASLETQVDLTTAAVVSNEAAVALVDAAVDLERIQVDKSNPLEIARGNVSGMSSVNKFGRNPEIDSGVVADIWDGGKTLASGGTSLLWVAPTVAAKHNVASTDAGDTSGGAGARTLKIYGLTDWDTAEVSEIITMNGTTDVETANSYVIIHRMKVITKGPTNVNIGTIDATAKAPSATTITARIAPGVGQTRMAIYGMPSIQIAYMWLYYSSVNKAGGANALVDMTLMFNPEPDVELTNFLTKQTCGLQTGGSSDMHHYFTIPKIFEGPGIIKVQADSGAANLDISSGFDLVLVDI